MTCLDAQVALQETLDRSLSLDRLAELSAHLACCAACRQLRERLALLDATLASGLRPRPAAAPSPRRAPAPRWWVPTGAAAAVAAGVLIMALPRGGPVPTVRSPGPGGVAAVPERAKTTAVDRMLNWIDADPEPVDDGVFSEQ